MSKVTLANVGSLIDTTTAATTINSNTAAIVTAFDNTISRDGSSPNQMNASLDMNSNNVINMADGVGVADAVTVRQFNQVTTVAGNMPIGGSTGQALLKASNASYDTVWATPLSVPGNNFFGGRLTATAGAVKPTSNATSATLWYSPFNGSVITLGGSSSSFLSGPTDQNGWSLNISGLATGSYNIYSNGTGLYTGAFATVPVRYNGCLTDPAANTHPYLGSITVSTGGQITCHVSDDFNRRWEVYNYYNQFPIELRVLTQERDSDWQVTNHYSSLRAFNNNALNCGNIFTGQTELVEIKWMAQTFVNTINHSISGGLLSAIGWDSTTFGSGKWGGGTCDTITVAAGVNMIAEYKNPTSVGVHKATMLGGTSNVLNTDNVIRSSSSPGAYYDEMTNNLMFIRWNG